MLNDLRQKFSKPCGIFPRWPFSGQSPLFASWVLLIVLICASSSIGEEDESSESWGPRMGIDIPEVPRIQPDRMFLRRDWEPYENYAHEEKRYKNYSTILSPYRDPKQYFYGPLGNRLVYGIPGYDWVETTGLGPQSRGSSILRVTGNLYNYPGREQSTYRRYFEDVLTVSEQTNRWWAGLTIAQELRGRFTPLTLKVNAFRGFRIDVGTEHDDLSALFMNWNTVRMGRFTLSGGSAC